MPNALRCLAAAAVLLATTRPIVADPQIAHQQAFLLARGDDYYIHAVPLAPGYVLVHTLPGSGVMRPFFQTRPRPADPDGRCPDGAPETEILGTAADGERFYVLSARRLERSRSGRTLYTLSVFKQDTVELLHAQPLSAPAAAAETLWPTLGRGPIELVEGGVTCLQTTLWFDGHAVARIRTPDGREFTPPPAEDGDAHLRSL